MPNYQNAAKGVKKIFKAEVLEVIAVVLGAIASICVAFAAVSVEQDAAVSTIVSLAVMLVLASAAGVLAIISLIFSIIGLRTAGNENDSYKQAMIGVIISLALQVVVLILNYIFQSKMSTSQSEMMTSLSQAASKLVDLFITFYVIKGSVELLSQKGDADLADRGTTVLTRVLIAFAIALLLTVCPVFVDGILSIITVVFSLICSLLAYFQYLAFLKAAGDSLAKAE